MRRQSLGYCSAPGPPTLAPTAAAFYSSASTPLTTFLCFSSAVLQLKRSSSVHPQARRFSTPTRVRGHAGGASSNVTHCLATTRHCACCTMFTMNAWRGGKSQASPFAAAAASQKPKESSAGRGTPKGPGKGKIADAGGSDSAAQRYELVSRNQLPDPIVTVCVGLTYLGRQATRARTERGHRTGSPRRSEQTTHISRSHHTRRNMSGHVRRIRAVGAHRAK